MYHGPLTSTTNPYYLLKKKFSFFGNQHPIHNHNDNIHNHNDNDNDNKSHGVLFETQKEIRKELEYYQNYVICDKGIYTDEEKEWYEYYREVMRNNGIYTIKDYENYLKVHPESKRYPEYEKMYSAV
jgi:hypothetical protein